MPMPVEELFFELGMVLIIAGALSMIVYRFKQPLIIAYILTGIVAGPSLLALAHNSDVFEIMSKIGVAFLLFTVGMGLNWRSMKDVGGISLATGVGQVLMTTVLGFAVGLLLGFDPVTSIYIAVAFAFSSTIIVVKLLMDKEQLDSLHGRISIGFLLVQDFIAMIILLGLDAVKSGATLEVIVVSTLLKAAIIIPAFWILSTKILPPVLRYVARSQELLLIFAIAWCFLIAGILVAFGFGIELGALIAGVTLSGSTFQREINARMRPLRDFFLIMFFIVLGTRLGLDTMHAILIPSFIFSAFVLISNSLIVMWLMGALGYHPRTGFLFGTAIAQVSEFSFIVIVAGMAAGHLDESVLALATLVGIITIAISAYMIEHNDTIYDRLSPLFKRFEPTHTLSIEKRKEVAPVKVLLFGCHDSGTELLPMLKRMKSQYLIVDFDPQVIRELSKQGIPCMYGDVGDAGFLEEIKADKARLIISTIPDLTISTSILSYLKARKYTGSIIVSVHTITEADLAYSQGATYVIVPSVLSGMKFSEILKTHKSSKRSWATLTKQHLKTRS
jgi:Kef-type K+ transport system membrane component KefB